MYELFDTIKKNIEFAINICTFFLNDKIKSVSDKISTMNYQKLQFDTIYYINSTAEKMHSYGTVLYNNYEFIARIVDLYQYIFTYLVAIIQYRKAEPLINTWSCVSVLTKSYYNYKNFNYSYVEVYEPKYNLILENVNDMILENVNDIFINLYEDIYSIISNETSIIDSLITIKYNKKYIHRVVDNHKNSLDTKNSKISLDESNVKFLSIEYRSKDYCMRPIVLELKNEEYLVNNEIFSAIFVKRLLEYQIPYHKFDSDYEIALLDNNLKTVYLKFGEYIKLNKTDYSVLVTGDVNTSK
jgi:hypothetical protein